MLLALSHQEFHQLFSGSPVWLSVATSSPAQGERAFWETQTTGLEVLRRVPASLHSHSLATAACLIWVWAFQQSREDPEEAAEVVHGLECDPLCGEAEAMRFVQTGDEKASRGNLHRHLQGDHQESSLKISTTDRSRRTKAADMNQNNFGLDMGGIFHHGEGRTWQQVAQRGCAASVLGGLQDLTDHGKKSLSSLV